MLLKELTELNGASGIEDDVRNYLREKASGLADELKIDSIGNLIAFKKGTSSGHRIMLSAHMDEVGFMVTGYGENGTLKFASVGGVDNRILPGKKVLVGERKLQGVIGSKPIHLQDREERNNTAKIKSMYIDIGADSREEAEKLISPGEYIHFFSEYTEMGGNCIKAKALDDRAGCAVLLEALKGSYSFDLYSCFTVQEEVGLRGSEVAAYSVQPDLALVIEGTTCSDVPDVEKQDYSTRLGAGPALTIVDRTAYADKGLVDFIYNTAKRNNLKIQFKQTATGGNDAGMIQRSRGGVKVAAISVPCRYIHSPVSMMSRDDFDGCIRLVRLVLDELSNYPEKIDELKNGGKANV